ncbi:hypothetical protein OIU78_005490 [Salix suchowensis]|nr:hypothetical protein OIU78_005490 [Salix suchowensis]
MHWRSQNQEFFQQLTEEPHSHTKPISEIHSRGVRSRFGSSSVLLRKLLILFRNPYMRDMRSLHIEVLRQFHMQEMGLSGVMNSILENQAGLMKELSLPGKKTELRKML